jgi:tetratricopeptide (TPR) repeat protein
MERNINSKIYIENVEEGDFVDQPILPNSIPLIKGFVGREDYLDKLRESYQKGWRCFVMHGIGGVGKTAMALQFASEIAGEYEAKIRVDMQGMSKKNPLSARDAMLAVVREFERDIAADIPEGQLKNLYVSKLQNQPTLIVLDNAANIEAVESLNQTEACLIVTSRQSFILTNGKSKQIAKMSPEDARELLHKNGGEERFDGRADELAELAGHLPMALKPLAALLAEDELETAANLIERYRNKQELLKERVPDYDNLTIEASFELSYEALSDEMKDHWRRLSVFPADFDEAAIKFVLYISEDEARATQKRLRNFSLLEVNIETRRFSLHDLLHDFADKKLLQEERFTAQYRHAYFYILVMQEIADMKSDDTKIGFTNSLKLIDVEWKNIIAGQGWSAKFFNENDSIAEICSHYAKAASKLTYIRLTPRERIIWFEYALIVDLKRKDKNEEGFCLGNLGLSYTELGEYEKAVQHLEQALIIAQNTDSIRNEAAWVNNLGRIYIHQDKNRKAAKFLKRSLKIDSNPENQCISLINLGSAFLGSDKRFDIRNVNSTWVNNFEYGVKRRGNRSRSLWWYEKSFDFLNQAKILADKSGNNDLISSYKAGMGEVFLRLKEFQTAKKYFTEALEIQKDIRNPFKLSLILFCLASIHDYLGEKEDACILLKEALQMLDTIESPNATPIRQWIEKNCGN